MLYHISKAKKAMEAYKKLLRNPSATPFQKSAVKKKVIKVAEAGVQLQSLFQVMIFNYYLSKIASIMNNSGD